MSSRKSGFTKIELFAVLSILVLLMGLLFPAVQNARESARKITCSNNLRQIGVAIHSHESVHQRLPSLYNGEFRVVPFTAYDEFYCHSWRSAILPQLEQSALHAALKLTLPATHASLQEYVNTDVAVFKCASTPTPSLVRDMLAYNAGGPSTQIVGTASRSDYEAVGGAGIHYSPGPRSPYLASLEFGVWGEPTYKYDGPELVPVTYRKARFRDVTDGLSTTLVVVERSGRPDWYVDGRLVDTFPYADPRGGDHHQAAWAISTHFLYLALGNTGGVNHMNMTGIYSFHVAGANGLMSDGSVHFLSSSTDPAILNALATRSYRDMANLPQ